jgi:alanyl-tRNA synthetase
MAISSIVKGTRGHLRDKIFQIISHQKQLEKEIESLKAKLLQRESAELLSELREVDGIRVIVRKVRSESPKELREFADRIKEKLKSGIIVLGADKDKKAMLICVVTKDLIKKISANDIIKELSSKVGGRGGGRDDMAQGGGPMTKKLDDALASVDQIVRSAIKED